MAVMVSKRVLAPFGVSVPVPAKGEQYATVKVVAGVPYVVLDGPGGIMTPCTATAMLNDGDRVIVRIANHRATVTGNLSSKAVDERAADEIDRASAERAKKIKEAVESVERSVNDAYDEIGSVNRKADEAAAAAGRAQEAADEIGGEIKPIKEGIEAARRTADGAVAAIDEATRAVLAALEESYEVETEAATMGGALGTLVEASAAGISSKVSREEYQKNSEAVNGALGELSGKLYGAAAELEELDRAKLEAEAQLASARDTLAAARKLLDDLEASGDATAEQLEGARATVREAEAKVSQAERNLDEASEAVEAARGDIDRLLALIAGMGDRITNAESSFEQTAADITLQFQQLVQGLDVTDESVLRLLTWFRFAIDGLVIGRSGNDMAAKLTNEGLGFIRGYDGPAPVFAAYVAGDTMYTGNSIVMDSLRFNNFVWQRRVNGNMSLKRLDDGVAIDDEIYRMFGVRAPGDDLPAIDPGAAATVALPVPFAAAELGEGESEAVEVAVPGAGVISRVEIVQVVSDHAATRAAISEEHSAMGGKVVVTAVGPGVVGAVEARVTTLGNYEGSLGGGE
ncbi:hypothetical protein AALA69_03330 [Eggerthellaceae bacterium 24-137]